MYGARKYLEKHGGLEEYYKAVASLKGVSGNFVKVSTKSSLSTSLFNQLDNALASAPSIKFDYAPNTLQTPKQFLNATGNDMYDIILSNGAYAKFDNETGRMLYAEGGNNFFVRYTDDGVKVSNVESFVKGKIIQLRNCVGFSGSQIVQLPTSLGGSITTSTTKISTFIGKTTETQILKDQFGNFKHIEVGETAGSINLLNMPDPYWNPSTWFTDYNQGWMQRAINRGDDIYIVSTIDHDALVKFDGTPGGSYYANELNELIKAGIKPKNLSIEDWQLAKIEIKKYIVEAGSDLYRSLSNFLKVSYDDLVAKGLNAVEDAEIVNFLDGSGKQLAEISGGKLKFKYYGFGGDIVMTESKSTAVFGRFNDPIHGGGTKEFIQNPTKMFETGANPNGINILNIEDWTWAKNKAWVIESANRGDVIRFISDPTNPTNIFKNGISGERTVTGLEIQTLENLGYVWDASKFQYLKP